MNDDIKYERINKESLNRITAIAITKWLNVFTEIIFFALPLDILKNISNLK